jgi:predicted Zn-dependent protease
MKYSRVLSAAALLAVFLAGVGCNRKQGYIPMNKQILTGSGKVYLVPLGNFPAEVTDELASFYRKKYRLAVETLPNVPLSQTTFNQKRRQLIAEQAVESMKEAYPELKNDPQALLIGLTNLDMYIAKYNWQFSFSWRDGEKYAVVSGGRMHLPPSWSQKITGDLILSRIRKMVTKNVGLLYYDLDQSDNPRSVLYRKVGGVKDLDYMGEDF